MYQNLNDENLIMLTLAGDQNAYEALVVRYEKSVISAAYSVTHNRFMAEDAAQDAFVSAWMKLNILRDLNKYSAWVCRIAINCAKNMCARYREYLSIDELPNEEFCSIETPDIISTENEERESLHKTIDGLPQRTREIINLHYFEGLSIADIADKMRISQGTVKWQLHDGRKRIRKELCAMNEEMNDTLTRRVMKKVEELKLWQFKNNKSGFEVVYKDVLSEVEELPESIDKYHALADVLMRGWWWLPGDKNDALFARISDAAERGKNDEVMMFIASREDERFSSNNNVLIEFIRDKQIPRLEAAGFTKSLANEWHWLGYLYIEEKQFDNGFKAYEKALSLLTPADIMYAQTDISIKQDKLYCTDYIDKPERSYQLIAGAEEYHFIDGQPRRYKDSWYNRGKICSTLPNIEYIFRNASLCDGHFIFDNMSVGDTYIGSDNTS